MKRQFPKYVRQTGNVSNDFKIYIEDYVDTFFNHLCDDAEKEMMGAFLIGEIVHEDGRDYIYVYGALKIKELITRGKDFIIEESTWENAYETCKEYFGDADILGWFVAGDEQYLEMNHNIQNFQQEYFPSELSVFVTKNIRDREETYYIYKYHNMMECTGHYIYYDNNVEMQNYIISVQKK